MKLVGDVSEEHKKLAEELMEHERYWDTRSNVAMAPTIAKAYTCLAHDWYQLGDDEHGQMLLQKAEEACPGYFRNVMLLQAEEDRDFNQLVKSLVVELTWILVSRINEVKGK